MKLHGRSDGNGDDEGGDVCVACCCDMQHEGHSFLIKCKVKIDKAAVVRGGKGKGEKRREASRMSGTKMRPVDHAVNCRPQDV